MEFVGQHLKPLISIVRHLKTYDTSVFLNKLKDVEKLLAGTIMVTTDVVGLYPHIPHDAGLEAIKEALNRREDQEIRLSTNFFFPASYFSSSMRASMEHESDRKVGEKN